jgi:hypothetical protein
LKVDCSNSSLVPLCLADGRWCRYGERFEEKEMALAADLDVAGPLTLR